MTTLGMEEVFKISGVPTYTFVEPVEYNRICLSLRTPGRGIVIEGPSGIGKTCAIVKALNYLGMNEITEKLSARKKNDLERIEEIIGQTNLGTVLIDDFHRLSPELKEKIADYLKTLADEEVVDTKIVIVGINRAGETLIRFAEDLVNRIDIIKFEINPESKVQEILEKGEKELNIEITSKNEIVKESHGSFYLAQMLAYETCLYDDLLEKTDEFRNIFVSLEVVKQTVYERMTPRYMVTTKSFASGPKLNKTGRAPYLHILHWVTNSESWSISIEDELRKYTDQKSSVGQIVEKGYLKKFMDAHPEFENLFNFDPLSNIFTIEDPQFIFFLRNIIWSKFAQTLGFKTIFFESRYDFALSFAGSDREMAEMIFQKLTENELSIFVTIQPNYRQSCIINSNTKN
ncbi:ATP-binding protein [Methanococcoides seepicolus]|uniref:Uncharacterized protein n=1 Tax=Methanococcoides seepicolus TaxID=2828780 RepID=A0A9E4ZI44_9EURY|nr:hypothetical protein [Methanococcoides seepicolus]MCM1987464.1 hypothetical protein [Methanococcoides seepicolus]